MWSKTFALAVLERAIKTFAQSAAALLVAAGTGLLDADWVQIASVSGMAAVVSVLTSVGTGAVTDGSPSVGNVETVAEWPLYEPQRAAEVGTREHLGLTAEHFSQHQSVLADIPRRHRLGQRRQGGRVRGDGHTRFSVLVVVRARCRRRAQCRPAGRRGCAAGQ